MGYWRAQKVNALGVLPAGGTQQKESERMSIIGNVKQWFFGLAVKKALTRAIPWLISLASVLVARGNDAAGKYGVTVNLDTAALGSALALGLAVVQNWVKTKTGAKWL